MDKSKQPGIACLAIMLIQSSSSRGENTSQELETKMNFENSVAANEDGTRVQVRLKATMQAVTASSGDQPVIEFMAEYLGEFGYFGEDRNMDLNHFAHNHAPAVLFPYIRYRFHDFAKDSNIPDFIIPPMNILAMIKEAEKAQDNVQN